MVPFAALIAVAQIYGVRCGFGHDRVVPFAALIAVACSCDGDSTAPGGNKDASADASMHAATIAAPDPVAEASMDAAHAQARNLRMCLLDIMITLS